MSRACAEVGVKYSERMECIHTREETTYSTVRDRDPDDGIATELPSFHQCSLFQEEFGTRTVSLRVWRCLNFCVVLFARRLMTYFDELKGTCCVDTGCDGNGYGRVANLH